jgi:hypothetical protein
VLSEIAAARYIANPRLRCANCHATIEFTAISIMGSDRRRHA